MYKHLSFRETVLIKLFCRMAVLGSESEMGKHFGVTHLLGTFLFKALPLTPQTFANIAWQNWGSGDFSPDLIFSRSLPASMLNSSHSFYFCPWPVVAPEHLHPWCVTSLCISFSSSPGCGLEHEDWPHCDPRLRGDLGTLLSQGDHPERLPGILFYFQGKDTTIYFEG